jgi:formamidopyrimidine-DNA glycosylase
VASCRGDPARRKERRGRGRAVPELPEVETTVRALQARLAGRRVAGPSSAAPTSASRSRRPRAAAGRAHRERLRPPGEVHPGPPRARTPLLLHLGMSGRLLFDGEPRGPHEHVTLAFDDGTTLRFVDPRRFGMLDLCAPGELASHKWLRHLGLEPLDSRLRRPPRSSRPWPAAAPRSRWR